MSPPAYSSIVCFRRPLWVRAYCLRLVAAWAAECSDTAWNSSLIIRQMGRSRCGPCGDSGAVWGVEQGPAASPLPPHPTVTGTQRGLDGLDAAGRIGPPPSTPSCPVLPPFPSPFLLLWAVPTGARGASFVTKHTHTQNLKDTSWIWQRLWKEGRLRSKINYLQLSGYTSYLFSALMFHDLLYTLFKWRKCTRSPSKERLRDLIARGAALTPPPPPLPNCTTLNLVWDPACVTVPV